MASLLKLYGHKPILVIGPRMSRSIMEEYGFQHVYTTNDLHSIAPSSWPFKKPMDPAKVEVRVSSQMHSDLSLAY